MSSQTNERSEHISTPPRGGAGVGGYMVFAALVSNRYPISAH